MSSLFVFLTAWLLMISAISHFAAESAEIVVLSYNIHHGEGLDRKLDLNRIAGIITASKADLVALQEVDRNTKRSEGVDQASELARLTGMKHVFGKAIDYQGGEYGQAILSRWPILTHQVHHLPQKPDREQRIALVAVIDAPASRFQFASTHLDHQIEAIRIEQAQALNAKLSPDEFPRLLAGDFNAEPGSETMTLLLKEWENSAESAPAPTIPATKPTKQIDYILFRPKALWQVVKTEVLNEPLASDHRPVLARLKLRHNRE